MDAEDILTRLLKAIGLWEKTHRNERIPNILWATPYRRPQWVLSHTELANGCVWWYIKGSMVKMIRTPESGFETEYKIDLANPSSLSLITEFLTGDSLSDREIEMLLG